MHADSHLTRLRCWQAFYEELHSTVCLRPSVTSLKLMSGCLFDEWRSISVQVPPAEWCNRRLRGVAILHSGDCTIGHISTHAEEKFQLITATVNRSQVVAAYVSPETPLPICETFLRIKTPALKGPGVLVVDFSARHNACDDKKNTAGCQLHLWPVAHNFKTQRLRLPTFQNHAGSSRVNLILHIGPIPLLLTVEDANEYSDHRLVPGQLVFCTPTTVESIPLSLSNKRCGRYARAIYAKTIPPITSALQSATSAASLETNTSRLALAEMESWTNRCLPRPSRYKSGWTRALDVKSKQCSRLFKSSTPADWQRARQLDRDIKLQFRRNLRKLKRTVADGFAR